MKLTARQIACDHTWHTELGSHGMVFHTCTQSCGLRINAGPQAILLMAIELNIQKTHARRVRMTLRNAWKELSSLSSEFDMTAIVRRQLEKNLETMLQESRIPQNPEETDS